MAVHGKATGVIVGTFDPSRYFTEITLGWTLDTHDSTGFMTNSKEYTAGLNDSSVSASGFYQPPVGVTDESVQAEFEAGLDGDDVDRLYLVLFGGWSVGARVTCGPVLTTSFEVSSPVADLVSTTFALQGQPGRRQMTVVLPPTTPLTDTAPNGATLDGTAGSVNGALVQVHVLANTMDAATDLIVQHSTDGTTWADAATLAVAAGVTSAQRLEMLGAVNRYVRVIVDPSGEGSVQAVVALARN